MNLLSLMNKKTVYMVPRYNMAKPLVSRQQDNLTLCERAYIVCTISKYEIYLACQQFSMAFLPISFEIVLRLESQFSA